MGLVGPAFIEREASGHGSSIFVAIGVSSMLADPNATISPRSIHVVARSILAIFSPPLLNCE
jgi:hypothetical protein